MDRVSELLQGRYRLLEHLGVGGMGTVWRAEDTVLGREVAVKEVTFPAGTSPEEAAVLRERTRREARAAARLSHPNAVTVFDVVEEDGRPWLVMELVRARTLAQAVREDGPLDPARTARVGLAVLGALEAAHAQGILHRDVKPSNVLLAPAGDGRAERAVLTDFGIALSTGDASLTSSGLLLGSPAYIAPERAQGRAAGPASDLWSLGATLFTAVEGRPPYDQGDPLLTVTAVVTGEHGPFARAGRLGPVLDALLAKDPEQRLTAPQARARLQEVADAPAGPAPRPAPDPDRTRLLGAPLAALPVEQLRGLPDGDPSTAPAGAGTRPAPADPPATGRATAPGPRPAVARPTAPARRGPQRAAPARRGPLLAAAAAVVLLAGLVAGGVALTRGSGSPPRAATPSAPASTSPSAGPSPTAAAPPAPVAPATPAPATSSPATAPTTPPGPGTAALPAGWVLRDGPGGWAAGVPATWTTGTFGGFPEYRDPATGAVLRVSTGPGNGDPVADRQAQARSFAAAHPTYSQIAITPLTYQGVPAADWEFTYEGLHVRDRVFVVGGRGYSLYVQAREGQWDGAATVAQQLFGAFRPAGS